MTPENLIQALNWRYAVKKFDPTKKLDPKIWDGLLEVTRLTPSSYGLQPWKFISVENFELRQKLREVSRNQSQVTDCSHYLVITYLEKINEAFVDKHLTHMANTRNLDIATLAPFKKAVMDGLINGRRSNQLDRWAERQTFIAMGQVMTAAALLKIDTCPMEGIEPEAYDQLLSLEGTGFKTLATIAFGFRADDDKYAKNKKVRFDKADLFEVR